MRFLNLLKGELQFTYRYGIVFMYLIFILLYVAILSIIPFEFRSQLSSLLIFTDPAAMGLFFMGALLMLEKSQRVNLALFIAPIQVKEYIFAKCIPLCIIGMLVTLPLALTSGLPIFNVLLSVGLSSFLFSFLGLILASRSNGLNSFLMMTIPIEIFICIPAFLYLYQFIQSSFWLIHPGYAAMVLFSHYNNDWILAFCSLIIWNGIAYFICHHILSNSIQHLKGNKI